MIGFAGFGGLASQTGFDSATAAVVMSAGSSGEHETSLISAVASLGRVWEKAAEAKSAIAKETIRDRGNSFLTAIDGELPLPAGMFLLCFCISKRREQAEMHRHLSLWLKALQQAM